LKIGRSFFQAFDLLPAPEADTQALGRDFWELLSEVWELLILVLLSVVLSRFLTKNISPMKQSLILLFLLSHSLAAQPPMSIQIGTGTLSSLPLHINYTGELGRFQGTNPFLTFYNGENWNGFVQAYGSIFAIGTKNNLNLEFYTGDLLRFSVGGSTGQSTAHQRLNALDGISLTGALRVAGNSTGASGEVLTSAGNATPTWTTVNSNPQVGFQAKYLSDFTIPYGGVFTNLTNLTENWDDGGNNFNASTGEFTVPSSGLYHFEYHFLVGKMASNANITNGFMIFRLTVNNNPTRQGEFDFKDNGSIITNINGQMSIKLNAGDVVKLAVSQFNETLQPVRLLSNSSISDALFICYKIY
jgi:hypothetical protein